MQENIDIVRRPAWRNVLEAEFQISAHKIDNERPFEVGVAISADESYPRADRAKLVENSFRANVSEMPDFICIFRHFLQTFR